jgi:hypothetical protein
VKLTATDLSGTSISGDFNIVVASTSTSVVEGGIEIHLYPNPSHGLFVIESELTGKYTVRVTDMTGNLIKQYKEITLDRFKIDLSGHSNGMYYIEVSSAGQVFKEKLLKY